jgi:NAD(P)H-hydrate epimerase
MAENEKATGNIHVLNIGLSPRFYEGITSDHVGTDEEYLRSIYQPRKRFSHKGHYGHSLIVAGSHGKMGAAILCAKACLRSGSGLVSCHIPAAGYYAIQVAVPEVMVNVDIDKTLITNISEDLALYEAIGVGPGIGTAIETKEALLHLFSNVKNSVVADADALNLMAMYPELFNKIPRGSVLTPHPKEFERLFGITGNDFERMSLARKKATENNIIIVLKGHHTLIALPDGKVYFNTTGNAGMATAGSGDVLTGIITGLIAQGYSSANAAVLGVYLHGMAADLSLESQSKESLIAGDIIDNLGKAFKQIDLAI